MSKKTIISRMDSDGRLWRQTESGWKQVTIPEPLPGASEDEPAYDPDNPPLTPADFTRMKRVPRIKTLRRALQLTQNEFSNRYRIPVATIREWEEGRSEPDAPAKAFLHLIATDPKGVAEKLARRRELNLMP